MSRSQDINGFLRRLIEGGEARRHVCHVEELRAREARYAEITLDPRLQAALARRGISRLYTHQAEAISHVREGKNVVVVTGTASGKTLCYWVPIAESLLADPLATALAIYPTKALAQDQFRGLEA